MLDGRALRRMRSTAYIPCWAWALASTASSSASVARSRIAVSIVRGESCACLCTSTAAMGRTRTRSESSAASAAASAAADGELSSADIGKMKVAELKVGPGATCRQPVVGRCCCYNWWGVVSCVECAQVAGRPEVAAGAAVALTCRTLLPCPQAALTACGLSTAGLKKDLAARLQEHMESKAAAEAGAGAAADAPAAAESGESGAAPMAEGEVEAAQAPAPAAAPITLEFQHIDLHRWWQWG